MIPSSPLFTKILEIKTLSNFAKQSLVSSASPGCQTSGELSRRLGFGPTTGNGQRKSSSNADPDLAKIVVDRRGHPLNTIFFFCLYFCFNA